MGNGQSFAQVKRNTRKLLWIIFGGKSFSHCVLLWSNVPKRGRQTPKNELEFCCHQWESHTNCKLHDISDPYFLKFLSDPSPILCLKVIPSFNPHFQFCLRCRICQTSYMVFSYWSYGYGCCFCIMMVWFLSKWSRFALFQQICN